VSPAAVDTSERHAIELDAADPLTAYRERFAMPAGPDGRPGAYLAGNSLGAQPHAARAAVEGVLDAWGRRAVEGWFDPDVRWIELDAAARASAARLVGAAESEVATLNTLTLDLHLLLDRFYRPAGRRTAILIDAPTFPSDRYAVESRLRRHGRDPGEDLVVVRPRDGESLLRIEDLEGVIAGTGDRLAVALLAGVNYATGQALPIGRLTRAVHDVGGVALWDLAHAAGNVELSLAADGVDGAAWCTYKYLNSGPGALGQLFVAARHTAAESGGGGPLAGWWGNAEATRFAMAETFDPAAGASGWRTSTPPILSLAPIAPSLAIFDEVGMPALRRRSVALTGYLEALIDALVPDVTILTPRDPAERGAQLSVRVPGAGGGARARLAALEARGVIGDVREPDIIRLAPAPLYDTFHDAWRAATALAETAVR
jgi:kynureninase